MQPKIATLRNGIEMVAEGMNTPRSERGHKEYEIYVIYKIAFKL